MSELAACRKRSARGWKSAPGSVWVLMIAAAVAFALLLGSVAADEAYGATDSIVTSKLQQIQKKKGYIPGECGWKYWTNPKATGCASGCWHFLSNVTNQIFGVYPLDTDGYKVTKLTGWKQVGQYAGKAANSPGQTNVKTLMKKAYPGDVIQFRSGPTGYAGGADGQHSALVYKVTDTGITIYEHLDSSHVTLKTWTYAKLYADYFDFDTKTTYTKGVSLYHAANYGKHSFRFIDYDTTEKLYDSVTVMNGGKVTLPAPTKSGYVFRGWAVKRLDDQMWLRADGTWNTSGALKMFSSGSYTFDTSWTKAAVGTSEIYAQSDYRMYARWAKKISSLSVTLSRTSAVYDGESHTPSIYIFDNGTKLTAGKDYKVSWSGDCTALGTYTVTITGLGNYGGTGKATFTVKPATPVLTKASPYTAHQLKVYVDPVPEATGYTVLYSKSANFSSYKSVSSRSTTIQVKGLSAATKYYVKVRAYTAKSDGTVLARSSWSSVKNATTYTYAITYNLNGGKWGSVTPRYGFYKSSATFSLKNPTRAGYTFAGWYTSQTFKAGTKVTAIKKGTAANKTLYAKWVKS